MNAATLADLKLAMGYSDGTGCCKNCRFFVPTDTSGNHNSKAQHCGLSPAVDVPVHEAGRCNYFEWNTPKSSSR